MKKLIFLCLLFTGCVDSPKDKCDFRNGMRAFVGLPLNQCQEADSLVLCENYCNSKGEDYSRVLQMSYGVCICNNKEGQRAASSYHYCLNNPCDLENY